MWEDQENTKKGLWTNDQEWRDLVICQLIWIRTAIYAIGFFVAIGALAIFCAIKGYYTDIAFAVLSFVTVWACILFIRHQRKADSIEKKYEKEMYE